MRRRRIHPLEAMHAGVSYAEGARLTDREYIAGVEIRDRYEATLTRPPAINENPVQSSPNYDAIIIAAAERLRRYERAINAIPIALRPVVYHVCCEGRTLRDGFARNGRDSAAALADLRYALQLTANRLGL